MVPFASKMVNIRLLHTYELWSKVDVFLIFVLLLSVVFSLDQSLHSDHNKAGINIL